MNGRLGRYEITVAGGEKVRAYIPADLPPEPPLDLGRLQALIDRANQAIGRLDGVASILPDAHLFLYMYVRKEALLSSQIEGTQSSLSDLLLFEADESVNVPLDDVKEVSHYVSAMVHGLKRLEEGFPLSLRLIREMHAILLADGRGSDREPGEFRRSQNWIGGTRPGNAAFVPPPAHQVMSALGALEKFIHLETPELPLLVKAGLMHVQFETIHPFLDGNGRIGRLLITLLLCERHVLSKPLLYLSLYLKHNRNRYYELLQAVREHGDWETWLEFFLEGVSQTAEQAAQAAGRILKLFRDDRQRIEATGRSAASALRVHDLLQVNPLMRIGDAAQRLALSVPTVGKSLESLAALGIVREVTGRQRGRIYVYGAYLSLLSEGTEPLT